MFEVTLEDIWGSEGRVLDTARISASDRRVEGKELGINDEKLLRELMYFGHEVPFETVVTRWRIKCPIFVIRQLVKHRIASLSEKSKRYRGDIAPAYIPDAEFTYAGDPDESFKVLSEELRERMEFAIEFIQRERNLILEEMYDNIEAARERGELPADPKTGRDPWRARAREIARCMQPINEETEVIFTINFRSLMNFLWLRTSSHAQHEIREVADQMYEAMVKEYPLMMEVMKETFTARDVSYEILEEMFKERYNVV